MLVVRHTVLPQCLHSAAVRVVADMVCARAAAIELRDETLVGWFRGDVLEDALSHGRAADVAEADEEDGDWFGHLVLETAGNHWEWGVNFQGCLACSV